MTDLIKQRVVGMLLVLIAGIVFLPDLLDGKKEQTKEEFKKIPVRPQVESSPIVTEFPTEEVLNAIKKAPKVVELKADDDSTEVEDDKVEVNKQEPIAQVNTETDKVSTVANEDKTKDVKTVLTKMDNIKPEKVVKPVQADFEKNAWILQLGSFKHKENVDALKKRLTDAGFKVFIKPVETKAGVLSKVFVGPELERKNLEKAQLTLKELTGLDGKITQFDPIN